MAQRRKVSVGDTVMVKVDPRANGGSDEAAAMVVGSTGEGDDTRLSLRVFLNGDGDLLMKDVTWGSKPKDDDKSDDEDNADDSTPRNAQGVKVAWPK